MAGHLEIPPDWTPEFPGQRPPFVEGNRLAVTHGAYSAERTNPIARRIIEEVTSDPTTGYLVSAKYHTTLWKWAVVEAQFELVSQWAEDMDMQQRTYSAKGQTSPLELLRKLAATSLTLAKELGFTPASAVRLGKDLAQGRQADAATTLSALRAQHEAAQRGDDDDPPLVGAPVR